MFLQDESTVTCFSNQLAKRLQVRSDHIAGANKLHEDGVCLHAGAIVNKEGELCGSVLFINADSEDEIRSILDQDIYTKSGVWDTVNASIHPIKVLY